MTANDRTGVGPGSGEWRTPPDLFARLNRRFQFDYDAFASHENALCDLYSTVDGTFEWKLDIFEEHELCSEQDGLSFEWNNLRVFMNPPYSRGLIEQCVEKAFNERDSAAIIVALLPAATETRWFQRFILPHCHIDWLSKRVRFIDPVTLKVGGPPERDGGRHVQDRTDAVNNYDTDAYMERVRQVAESGQIAATASICRDCEGVIPRVEDNRGPLFRLGVRRCACGSVVTREEDLAAHGARSFKYGVTIFHSRAD